MSSSAEELREDVRRRLDAAVAEVVRRAVAPSLQTVAQAGKDIEEHVGEVRSLLDTEREDRAATGKRVLAMTIAAQGLESALGQGISDVQASVAGLRRLVVVTLSAAAASAAVSLAAVVMALWTR